MMGVEAADHPVFDLQKGIFTLMIQNILQRCPGLFADFKIPIHKIHCQRLCQNHADGAFSGAGHSDQNQIILHVNPPSNR